MTLKQFTAKVLLVSLAGCVSALPVSAEVTSINVNRACADIVGIPYGSDNFTDLEWGKFQECREYLRQFAEEPG
jgi:hypothetical protein